jgi:toxin ParE1/3/4
MKSPKPSSKTSSRDGANERAKLRLSRAAEIELEAIDAFSFEQFGDDVATAYMRGFDELFDLLRRHPRAGRESGELGKGLRQIMHRSHRILYRVAKDEVLIVRVLHHAMDARRTLRGAIK